MPNRQPAIGHFKTAFKLGKPVVTNKGPVALAFRKLAELAAAKGVQFRIEGTVISGTPTSGWPSKTWPATTSVRSRASSTEPPTTS